MEGYRYLLIFGLVGLQAAEECCLAKERFQHLAVSLANARFASYFHLQAVSQDLHFVSEVKYCYYQSDWEEVSFILGLAVQIYARHVFSSFLKLSSNVSTIPHLNISVTILLFTVSHIKLV